MDFEIEKFSSWEKLKNTQEPIIMYGTGNGADKVLDEFNRLGITLSGVTASSGFVRERFFRGFKVTPIEEFERIYESFTVVITFGSSIPSVMENIYNISKRHRTLVPCVPVIENEIFNRDFLEKNSESINKAYNLMCDDFSKRIFAGYVNFLFGGELDTLKEITTSEDEAFRSILKLGQNESYIDIGAYRGDTVDSFLKYTDNKYSSIVCAEPDTKTFKKLMEHCKNLDSFKAFNAAATDIDGEVYFSDLHGRQSSIGGDKLTPSVSLKTLADGIEPTFIKIDSEGCERLILEGGRDILKEFKPKINVAAYHKSEDIFSLPILINECNPQYKIHLRHHPYIPAWETCFYCI